MPTTRKTRFWLTLWLSLGALLLVSLSWAYFSFKRYERTHFEGFIPAQLELSETVLIQTDLYCGIAIFRLSDATLSRIESEGKSFFADATTARAPLKYPHQWYSTYTEWQSTPVPKDWQSEGAGSWMPCSSPHEVRDALVDTALSEGSYYTQNRRNGKLLVAPSLGLVVYSFFD